MRQRRCLVCGRIKEDFDSECCDYNLSELSNKKKKVKRKKSGVGKKMKIEFENGVCFIDDIKSASIMISRPVKNKQPKQLQIGTKDGYISVDLNRRNIKQLKDQIKMMDELDGLNKK